MKYVGKIMTQISETASCLINSEAINAFAVEHLGVKNTNHLIRHSSGKLPAVV